MRKILISLIAVIVSSPVGLSPVLSVFAQTSAVPTDSLDQNYYIGGSSGRLPNVRASRPTQETSSQSISTPNYAEINESYIDTLLRRIALLQDNLAQCQNQIRPAVTQTTPPPSFNPSPVQTNAPTEVQPEPAPTPQPDQSRICVLPREVQLVLSTCSSSRTSVVIYNQNTQQTNTVGGQSACTLERLKDVRGQISDRSECSQQTELLEAAIKVAERERDNASALAAEQARKAEIGNQRIAAEKERLAREQMTALANAERDKAALAVKETVGATLKGLKDVEICYRRRISTDVNPVYARAVAAGVPLTDQTLRDDLPKLQAEIQTGIDTLAEARLGLIQRADQLVNAELSGLKTADEVRTLLTGWLTEVKLQLNKFSKLCDTWRSEILRIAQATVKVAEGLQNQYQSN